MDEKKLTNRSLAPVLSIAGSDSSGGAGIQAFPYRANEY